jgi:hypothetical protein
MHRIPFLVISGFLAVGGVNCSAALANGPEAVLDAADAMADAPDEQDATDAADAMADAPDEENAPDAADAMADAPDEQDATDAGCNAPDATTYTCTAVTSDAGGCPPYGSDGGGLVSYPLGCTATLPECAVATVDAYPVSCECQTLFDSGPRWICPL